MANMVLAVPAHADAVRIMQYVTRLMVCVPAVSVIRDGKGLHVTNVSMFICFLSIST